MAAEFQPPDPAPVDQLPGSAEELAALRQADRDRMQGELEDYIQRRVAHEVAQQVQQILEQQTLLRHRMFGRSSEAHAGQGQLFNEAELETAPDSGRDEAETFETQPTPKQKPTRRGKRRPLPPELPRVETVVDVPEAERPCDCGMPRVKIGEEVSEQLDIVPMTVRVIRTVRPRYGCPQGAHAPLTAPAVPRVLPRRHFSAGLPTCWGATALTSRVRAWRGP